MYTRIMLLNIVVVLISLSGCRSEDTPSAAATATPAPAVVDKQIDNMRNAPNISPEAKDMIEKQARSGQPGQTAPAGQLGK